MSADPNKRTPHSVSLREPETKTRSTLAVDRALHRMAKTIASIEGRTVRELIDQLVAEYILDYVEGRPNRSRKDEAP